jgi:AraC-like DNA-binding protein
MNCVVHNISRFTNAQAGRQVLSCTLISFVSAGQTRIVVDGKPWPRPGPYLALFPKGATLEFEYTEQREQWAITLDLPGLTSGAQQGTVELVEEIGGGRFTLPMFTPIVTEHISGWDGEFLRLREAFSNPLPANRMRLRTGIGNVIRYVIDQHPDIYPSPAAKLRWLIDEDKQAQRSLAELSRQCGYSASRLRVLFEKEYGQSPLTYRKKRRMHIAADLLCNSDQRIKEISERIGCRHVSHFCSLFKGTHGLTPTRYQRKFRQR